MRILTKACVFVFQKRDSEKVELLTEVDQLLCKTNGLKDCLVGLDFDDKESAAGFLDCTTSSESSSNVQTDSSDLSHASGHLLVQGSIDEYDDLVAASLYSHPNEMYNNKDSATKCDNDLPVLTFCA